MSLRTAIFGAGLSGQSARRLALALGHEVTLFDEAGRGDRDHFERGDEKAFDRLVFSPGFGAGHRWRLLAERSDVACQGEIAFAAEHWRGKIIGVTGTNGKTTLTRLLTDGLQYAGYRSIAAGNIGWPLSDAVLAPENVEAGYVVCEISSFQAELADGLQLDAFLWTNFAEDHLDRYATMADYFFANARLLSSLRPDGICVIGPQLVDWFNLFQESFEQAVVAPREPARLDLLSTGSVFRRSPNTENFSLAAEYWRLAGQPEEALIKAANQFKLAAHRLDRVAEKDGVCFWDDSKATNFNAALAALEAVPRPIVWIGGGRVKGGDVESFAKEVSTRVDAAVLYGEAAHRLYNGLKEGTDDARLCPEFDKAVKTAAVMARSMGRGNVLLSPGFSSFDQFASYEERGKSFISIVLGL